MWEMARLPTATSNTGNSIAVSGALARPNWGWLPPRVILRLQTGGEISRGVARAAPSADAAARTAATTASILGLSLASRL